MTTLARTLAERRVARPLKVLVPLIKDDLRLGDEAALEYYRRAGEKLREAKDQLAGHRWTAWLSKNFALSRMTAWRYMRLAEMAETDNGRNARVTESGGSLRELTNRDTSRHRETRAWKRAAAALDAELFGRGREERAAAMRRYRELARQLIDLGYKTLATRLHPDRGGSPDAMRDLNRVRAELKALVETKRFD